MTDSSAGSPAASNAPASSAGTQGQTGQAQGQGSPTSAGTPDVHEMLRSMQGELAHLKQGTARSQAEARKAQERLQKVQQAFSDEHPDEEGDEDGADETWFNEALDQLLEARTKGVEMPITSKLVVALKESRQEIAELKKILKDTVKKTETLADPNVAVDQRAYDQMDGYIGESLGHVFGGEYPPTIAKAVTTSVVDFLRDLRREAPDKWTEIRRDAKSQRKIVQHFVNQHIPHSLREMQRNMAEARRPFTHNDAREALIEARQLKPEDRQKVMPHVRQKYWETMFANKSRRG